MNAIIVVDVQPRFVSEYTSARLVRAIRRAVRSAEASLVITDETDGPDESLVKGTHAIVKQYGGFCRKAIDLGLDEELEECVSHFLHELPLGETVPDNHPAVLDAEKQWPALMQEMRNMFDGRFPQMVADERWIDGIPNSVLTAWDGAVLCGGAREQCLAEVELAMRCLGLNVTVDESLCYW